MSQKEVYVDEDDVSAKEETESQGPRVQKENAYRQWQKGFIREES